MNLQLFLWPLKLPGIVLILAYSCVGYGLLFLIDDYFAIEPMSRFLTIGFSLPAWYAVSASLALFGQKILAHVAKGLLGEHMPQETDVNPFTSALAPKLTVLLLAMFAWTLYAGPSPGAIQIIFPVLVLPIFWVTLCVEESLRSAFTAHHIARLIGGLGYTYIGVAVLLGGSIYFMAYLVRWDHSFLPMLASAYLFLLAHTLAGALLFARRAELGLEIDQHEEIARLRDTRKVELEYGRLFHQLQRDCDNGNLQSAFHDLQKFMGDRTEELDPEIHQRLQRFKDQRLMLLHGVHYVQRLHERGENRKAWAIFKSCFEFDEHFRPLTDETLLSLTKASGPEDAWLVNEVLRDFHTAYPDSKDIPAAQFRRARVCFELLGDRETATSILDELARTYPDFAAGEEFTRYRNHLHQ